MNCPGKELGARFQKRYILIQGTGSFGEAGGWGALGTGEVGRWDRQGQVMQIGVCLSEERDEVNLFQEARSGCRGDVIKKGWMFPPTDTWLGAGTSDSKLATVTGHSGLCPCDIWPVLWNHQTWHEALVK